MLGVLNGCRAGSPRESRRPDAGAYRRDNAGIAGYVPHVEASSRPHDGRRPPLVYDSAFAHPADLGRLRAGAIAALEEQGRTRDHVRVVGLLLSELATNALMHATSPYRLTVEMDADETFVEVTDAGDGDAFARAPAHVDGGYGLNLVNALASRWGTEPCAHGKTVWAAVGRDLTF